MDEQTQTEVVESATPALEAPESNGAADAPVGVQGESAPLTEGQSPTTDETAGQAEAAFQVPENDDDLKGKENDPHVQAIIQMRSELRARDKLLDGYKPLETWKPLVETVGDPALAQSSYELVNALYTPSTENPSGFDPRPFLEKVEQDSPGTVDQLFATICSFPIQIGDETTTVVRELYKSHGLNPDRIEDYRNIDNLRASGIVSDADLAKIPEKYHDAFKALPEDARTDILSLKVNNPALADQYLRNAERSLASEKFEQQQREREQQETERQEKELAHQVETAVTQGVHGKIEAWSGSIHQNLSSQWKPSTDETINNLEYDKVIGTLAALQSPSPAYRGVAERALKAVGASLDGFDTLVNQWQESYSAAVTYEQMGQKDSIPAKRAQAVASQAEQRLLIKLNDYALKLAQPTSSRLANASQQAATQLTAASARYVPNGNGQVPQGNENPYMKNPHPVGTQEYYAYYRELDKANKLTGASMFG